ncbi:heparin lyase I family protein [Adhaeribacter arboris]|uniref:heparin lyase I family protein n=1 Tax=Adhaeribacter arboris TaxID=2072846 RepID=UPI001304FFFD|nr:heparin lyase I family protein [Adhaeribacter arboris]
MLSLNTPHHLFAQLSLPRTNLLVNADFSKGLPKGLRTQVYTSHGLTYQKFAGKTWARVELRQEDNRKGIVRAEFVRDSETHREGRIGYKMLIKRKEFPRSKASTIIAQFHNHEDKHLGEKALVPPIALFVQDDHFKVMVNYDNEKVTTNKTADGRKVFDLGPAQFDTPIDVVWFVKHSYQEDGVLILALNGETVLKYKGPNSYNDAEEIPYFKFGVYDREVNQFRVIYITDFCVGGPLSTYEDVRPK